MGLKWPVDSALTGYSKDDPQSVQGTLTQDDARSPGSYAFLTGLTEHGYVELARNGYGTEGYSPRGPQTPAGLACRVRRDEGHPCGRWTTPSARRTVGREAVTPQDQSAPSRTAHRGQVLITPSRRLAGAPTPSRWRCRPAQARERRDAQRGAEGLPGRRRAPCTRRRRADGRAEGTGRLPTCCRCRSGRRGQAEEQHGDRGPRPPDRRRLDVLSAGRGRHLGRHGQARDPLRTWAG